jgi:tRNA1(Val) A37 N6-methylase TrmN6
MERCGLQRDTVYLVRPDGYLAVVAAPDQTEALTSYFDKHKFHLADVKAGDRVRIS